MENNNPETQAPEGAAPAAPASTANPAENYVASELDKARVALRNTQIASIALVAFIAIYMGYMTSKVSGYAQPDTAAEVAVGIIQEKVENEGQAAVNSFKDQIPEVMKKLPDTVIEKMPDARKALEAQVESDLRSYCKTSADQLGKHFDDFLKLHKNELKTVFEVGADKESLHKIGPSLERELMGFITASPEAGGDSAKTKIDKALQVLKEIKSKTSRLANAKNLSVEERKTKRAIAIISQTVSKQLKNINLQQAVIDHVLAPPKDDAETVAKPGVASESPSPSGTGNAAAAPAATGNAASAPAATKAP